jgi:4-amino-4-deoxy-L-arabinose transferase-like glycosyltransferase
MLSRNTIILSGILLISAFMHLQHFPKELVSIHTWRQTQTQSNINNFYEEDMNILNPRRNDRGDTDGIFQMEFPLMQWLVAIQYKVFGNHLIISRLFMFLTGCFSVLGIWVLLEALFQKHYLSMMGAWAFTFSPNFYYYMINPMPDNLALCCGIWGLAFFFRWHNDQKWIDLLLSGLFFSISSLCKLPFIIYFVVPLAYFVQKIQKDGITRLTTWQILAAGSPVILPVAWYITVIPHWGSNMVVKGMLDNKEGVSRLIEYYQHILISTLPELLLNYGSVLFFLAGFYFLIKRKSYRDSRSRV